MHCVSKERMAADLLFSSECMLQQSITEKCQEAIALRFQLCSAWYTALQIKNS